MAKKWTGRNFIKISLEEVTTPKEGYECMVDRWWEVRDDCVLGYKLYGLKSKDRPSPQCNPNKKVTEQLIHDGSKAIFLPVAYWPANDL